VISEAEKNFPLWFPFVFLGGWLVIGGFLALVSGWVSTARHFAAVSGKPDGEVIRNQVLGVGPVGENNVTQMVATHSGLYLYPMFLFRFGRRPLFIPWPAITPLGEFKFLWSRYHSLRIGATMTVQITKPGYERLRKYLPGMGRVAG
jgi:hypothetical protein